MKVVKILSIMILALACAFVSFACSNAKSPVTPSNDLPESLNADVHSRSLLAAYDAVIDPVAKTFTVTPINRIAQYHFPLSQLYPNVLQITDFGWTPNFWADIKLDHPLPGSGIDGFDPRVIAILPANPDVRFIYPVIGVGGNNAVILEPDGYTKLFDNLGGSIPGNVNPFKAYFKDQPYRIWSNTEVTEETQRWQMDIAGFGGPMQYKLVVDVSTKFPNPSTPVVDNAPEPVRIETAVGSGLTPTGGSADINVTLLDWQWPVGIGGVSVEAPDLFNGKVTLAYSGLGPNPNEYVFTGIISNSLLAPEGAYKMLVATWDQLTYIYLYNEFTVNVMDIIEDGNLIWAKRAGGTDDDKGYGITTLSDNSTIVTGGFEGSATFGPGEPNETVLTSNGDNDIFIARYNPDGTLAWAKSAGGSGYDEGYGITTLSGNSTVVTGYFHSSATFGQGEPNETVLTAGQADIFIARYNPDGTLEWAKRAGGSDYDRGYGITMLSDNSTVVTGDFGHSATFGPGEPAETVLTTDGLSDIFIARYDHDGNLTWAKRAGGTYGDSALEITSLSDNSTVVTGFFGYSGAIPSATFGPGEINETILTSAGKTDIFIALYNSDGTLAWAKRAGGSDYDRGYGITMLSDNSTVVTGAFSSSATFGPGESNETILTSSSPSNIFIARYNPNGTLSWAKRAGGAHYDCGYGITTLSDDSTVTTGTFGLWDGGSATFGEGEPNATVLDSAGTCDVFIARYNSNGTFAWAKRAGGASADWVGGITSLSDNSTVVTGYFEETATFGPGETTETILTSTGSSDIFIASFKP